MSTAITPNDVAISPTFDPSKPLENDLHERFALSYIEKPMGKHAAISAGFKPSNASVTAWKLLNNPIVQQRISYLKNSCGWSLETTRYRVNERYEHWKGKSWQADKAFIELMADLMGHRKREIADPTSGILDKVTNLLKEYNKRYGKENEKVKINYSEPSLSPHHAPSEASAEHSELSPNMQNPNTESDNKLSDVAVINANYNHTNNLQQINLS